MKSILFVTQLTVSVEVINEFLVDKLKELADDNKETGGMILQW